MTTTTRSTASTAASATAVDKSTPLLLTRTTRLNPPHTSTTTKNYDAVGATTIKINDDEGAAAATRITTDDVDHDVDDQNQHSHKTTNFETILHLLKGYLGAGCLSLPYAVSQLGVLYGILSILALSYWTSSNCYTVVNIKRHMERTTMNATDTGGATTKSAVAEDDQHGGDNTPTTSSPAGAITGAEQQQQQQDNTTATCTSDNQSETSSCCSNITYPDVGNWAYGTYFQKYVSACIITLQMAVCTVYVSFIGENLLAVCKHYLDIPGMNHTLVMTVALPFILALSFLPSLKVLAPIMAVGTVLLLVSLAALGKIVVDEWSERPLDTPTFQPMQAPMALCMILYSYEGINLILPVQAAMKNPESFDVVFWLSMGIVAIMLATVAVVCVLAFGNVTNGSVTAFLLEAYKGDNNDDDNNSNITAWIMLANTAVSLSVLLTYPLTMYPAVELLGPILQRNVYLSKICGGGITNEGLIGGDNGNDVDDDDDDLAAFEPLPPLPEHDVVSMIDAHKEHSYEEEGDDGNADAVSDGVSAGTATSVATSFFLPAIRFTLPGDSMQLRASLVLATYLIAVLIPNVQALISLVGALAGSSAALLIPPVLELAWVEHQEHIDETTKTPLAIGTPPPPSPHILRQQFKKKMMKKKRRQIWQLGRYWKTKVKCYLSFALGLVFLGIGTTASIVDIVKIYMGKS